VDAQIVLWPNGDFVTRSNEVETVCRRVNPDDWDDDGIENELDPNPLFCDGDFFGPANILPEGANTNAYCTVSVVATGLVRYDYYDNNLKRMIKPGTIDVSGFVPGKYKLYKIGDFTIPVGASINLASWWGIGQSLSNYYPEGDADRKFELWVSLKFVGPNFGLKTEDGKDRMVCDRFFLVDRNGRKYKGE
jgi:hypothetical protein